MSDKSMEIAVCRACKGSGTAVPTTDPCKACNGSGYPKGYTPPSIEEVIRYLRETK